MEHDHQPSKTEGKSGSPPVRKNASRHLPSSVGALFDLQHAAGNRAVAKMLTASPNRVDAQRMALNRPAAEPISPITVQRDEFDAALKDQMDTSKLDFKTLAKGLIDRVNAAPDASDKEGGSTTEVEGDDSAEKGKTDTALPEPTKIPTQDDLDKREKALKERQRKLDHTPTAEEQKLLDKKAQLDALEQEMKDDAALKAREKKLLPKKKLTPFQEQKTKELDKLEQHQKDTKALEDREKKLKHQLDPAQEKKKEELDDLEEQQKDAEALKQWNKKRAKWRTPAGTSMKDLMKGRTF
jgi:chromosome segregation ATPase